MPQHIEQGGLQVVFAENPLAATVGAIRAVDDDIRVANGVDGEKDAELVRMPIRSAARSLVPVVRRVGWLGIHDAAPVRDGSWPNPWPRYLPCSR